MRGGWFEGFGVRDADEINGAHAAGRTESLDRREGDDGSAMKEAHRVRIRPPCGHQTSSFKAGGPKSRRRLPIGR
jgi:hypothetical protein